MRSYRILNKFLIETATVAGCRSSLLTDELSNYYPFYSGTVELTNSYRKDVGHSFVPENERKNFSSFFDFHFFV